jgi:hypothetical protein
VTPLAPVASAPDPQPADEFEDRRQGGIDVFRLIALRDRLAAALER